MSSRLIATFPTHARGFLAMAARLRLRQGVIREISGVESRLALSVPLASAKVSAGFPSPADDYIERPLDFNELLIQNAAATFAVRVSSDSMINVGIFPDDIVVINRAMTPKDTHIVIALLDGEFTLKRYRRRRGRVWLQAENRNYPDTEITEEMTFEIWGVVTGVVRKM